MRFARYYDSAAFPLHVRVIMYALDHDGQPLDRAQLHDAVDPFRLVRSAEITRAIRRGVRARLLKEQSCSAVLYVADQEDVA